MNVFCTLIVPADLAPLARALGTGLTPSAAGMWVAGCSAPGAAPATHYISTGMIGEEFVPVITDADVLHAACVEAGADVTPAQCAELVARCDVSDDEPFVALERLGLRLLVGELS